MQLRHVLTVALVALLFTPAVTAYAPMGNSAPVQGESAAGSGGVAAPDAATAASGNYTRLYIEEGYRHTEVKPGETTRFNVTVGNGEEHAVELTPHVVLPKVEGRPLAKDWVAIENEDTTLDAGEERTFTVTVSVPEDAELGDYSAQIAFTNRTISYGQGRPPQPVHAARINVEVFQKPTVEIRSERYLHTRVQAGNSYTYEVVVANAGDETVPLNPTLRTRESYGYHEGEENAVQRSWFDIEAPSEVAPGENATVSITVSPPKSAAVGDYETDVSLGLKDPARPERDDDWQQVNLDFQVWKQPADPFETNVRVSERTENLTLTLSADQYRELANERPVSFNVTFVAPDGRVADHRRIRVSTGGSVSLGSEEPRIATQGAYATEGDNQRFVYRVTDPGAGTWSIEILPENTTNFRYEVVRDES